MTKREKEKAEAKQLLLGHGDWTAVKPSDLLLFVVKYSRTSLHKRVKVYKVAFNPTDNSQHLLCLTRNVAVLMGLANSDTAEHKAFNNGMLTADGIPELARYLAVKLFGADVARNHPFIDEQITME